MKKYLKTIPIFCVCLLVILSLFTSIQAEVKDENKEKNDDLIESVLVKKEVSACIGHFTSATHQTEGGSIHHTPQHPELGLKPAQALLQLNHIPQLKNLPPPIKPYVHKGVAYKTSDLRFYKRWTAGFNNNRNTRTYSLKAVCLNV